MMSLLVRIAESDVDREACFAIRRAVFVEEQHVPLELEMDSSDAAAIHLLMRDSAGTPLATARLLDKSGVAKIGRVAVVQNARGLGLGLFLMQKVLEMARRQGFTEAMLDSQTYALPFYERLGFVAEGGEFDDAGLPHFRMRRTL